jgi:hypothetical protein
MRDRRKMKIIEKIEKEPYLSIINLTESYENPYRKTGLERMHYRWALIENHDNIKRTSNKNKMIKFFRKSPLESKDKKEFAKELYDRRKNDYLELLYELKIVKKDIIRGKSANNNLGIFLNSLVDEGILSKDKGANNLLHFSLTEKYTFIVVCNRLKKNINNLVSTVSKEVTDNDIQKLIGLLQGEIDFIDSKIEEEN